MERSTRTGTFQGSLRGVAVDWSRSTVRSRTAGTSSNSTDPTGTGVQPYGDWRGRTYSLSLTASF